MKKCVANPSIIVPAFSVNMDLGHERAAAVSAYSDDTSNSQDTTGLLPWR
jgi:hypothetical protein